jgi:transposase-like protein
MSRVPMWKNILLPFILFPVLVSGQVLEVPVVTQEQDQWCWVGVSCSVLKYYGQDLAQCTIAEYTRSTALWNDWGPVDCCTDATQGCNMWNYNYGMPGSIQDILRHWGVENTGLGSTLTTADVQTHLNAGRPFIIRWGWTSGGGHFVVGHGLNGTSLYYMDPWFGEGRKIAEYSWVVSGGTHTWTHTNVIFTNLPQLAEVALIAPKNDSVGVPVSPTFIWNKSASATPVYQFQISGESAFISPIKDSLSITDTVLSLSGLSNQTVYYWRVRFNNGTIAGAWSPVRRFTTIPLPPGIPSLVSPSDNAANQPVNLQFIWNSTTGAAKYRIQVATDVAFVGIAVDDSTLISVNKTAGPLTPVTTYYWRVSAINAAGTGGWSPVRSFTTVPPPPGIPSLVSPSASAVDQPVSLQLEWNSVAEALKYRVQLATNTGFTGAVVDDSTLTTTSRNVGPLSSGTTYYWRARASNTFGAGAWSLARSFTTVLLPPGIPTLVSPSVNAANQPVSLQLGWSRVTGATKFRVQLATDNAFTGIVVDDSTVTTVSRSVGPLSQGTAYYWRVSASNSAGAGAWSQVRSFTTVLLLPGIPTLVSPSENATDQPVSLQLAWNSINGAAKYRVQLATDNAFTGIVVDDSTLTTVTRSVGPLSVATTYYWRVSAINAVGVGAWSQIRSFSTVLQLPGIPVLVAPSDNAADQPVSLQLVWNSVAEALKYRVQLATNTGFTGTVVDDSTLTTTSRSVGPLASGTVHYWRVNAINDGGAGAWSPVRSFSTVLLPPGVPALTSPANNIADQPVSLELVWNTVVGTTKYRVQLATDNAFSGIVVDDSTLTTVSRSVGPLSPGTTYYWRVSAINAAGAGAWSQVRDFTTVLQLPGIPALASPSDNAADQPLRLQLAWNSVEGVLKYRVQLATDNAFTGIVIDDSTLTSGSKSAGPLSPGTTYYWRVNAINAGGAGAWSPVRGFTTVPLPPGIPLLVSPSDNAADQPASLQLVWNNVAGAVKYRVQLASDVTFTEIVVDDSVLTTVSRSVGPLSAGTGHYWRVNAINAGGAGVWSPVRGFTTVPLPPGIPSLV